jgi:type IV pilus assembly protein PilW
MKKSPRYFLQAGFTLVELMVSMVIGLLIVLALITLLINVNRNNSEMSKTNRQIENGRFAIQLLQNDIVHAGFWSDLDYSITPAPSFAVPTAIPLPCDVDVDSWTSAHKDNILAIPVQGFANGSTLTACGVSSILASSDVLIVRQANTCIAGSPNCEGGTDTGPHIQVSNCRAVATPEPRYVIAAQPASTASAPAVFPLKEKDCTTLVAAKRKLVTNIYYLANSNNLPTLMRVPLVNGAYLPPQPLIEGIEAFRVEYGIDTSGDGSPDSYLSVPPTTKEQLGDIVAVKIHVLARNLEPTPGYTDSKSYQLGATTVIPAANDQFKRHAYSTTVRLVNPSGRREMSL